MMISTRTHTHTHARTHARTRARTHADKPNNTISQPSVNRTDYQIPIRGQRDASKRYFNSTRLPWWPRITSRVFLGYEWWQCYGFGSVTKPWVLCRDDCYGSCHGRMHRDNALLLFHVVTMLWFLCRDDCYGSCHGRIHRDNAVFSCRDNAVIFFLMS